MGLIPFFDKIGWPSRSGEAILVIGKERETIPGWLHV